MRYGPCHFQEIPRASEEEWKRYYLSLQEGYQSVGFGYDQPAGDAMQWQVTTEQVAVADQKPYIPPEELQVPKDMQIPQDQKQNARIEKTASFIAQHGIQMEIMLKTKQAGNSQFDFLSFENELNAYYKHMVSMIKSGKYKPVQREEEEDANSESHNDNYLHPSLSSTSSLPPPPPPPSKPIELPKVSIHDTPYGALINSIRKHTEKAKPKKLETSNIAEETPTAAPLSYHYDSLDNFQASTAGSLPGNKYSNNPPPPGTEPVTLPMVSSLDGPTFVKELYGPQTNPQDGEDVSETKSRRRKKKKRRSSSTDSSSSSSSSSNSSRSRSPKKKRKSRADTPPRMHGPAPILPPPPDVCPIVDRMAMYVAKNGAEFEMVVMNRKDPRFQFLNEYHAYFPYYKLKKEMFIEEMSRNKEEDDKSGGNQRSISFSIKPRPKESEGGQPAAKQKPKLFEYDSSEGEEEKEERIVQETPSESGSLTPPPSRLLMDEDPQKEMEEKLKDKLANAVKERLSQTNRERQLQQERKKKAAMFLNLIKSSQPTEPSPPPPPEDSSALYVGEASPAPVVYEYDNGQMSHVQDDRSCSPKHKKRRRRSPTPPSAYSLDRRPALRPSPPRWQNRQSPWSSVNPRDRDRSPIRPRRSRSPHRKDEKKKKHRKHSRSRSPKHPEKVKDRSSKHSKEKSKHKSPKEFDRRKKEKSKHRSQDRELRDPAELKKVLSVDSDVEVLDKSPVRYSSVREDSSRLNNGKTSALTTSNVHSSLTVELGSIPVPRLSPFTSSSSENLTKVAFNQGKSSMSNSPSMQNSGSRSSTPGRTLADSAGVPASSDLMSKVRAMLKKSREMTRDEENSNLDESDALL
ncbi:splicing factor, suppressor of white-apricot [Elysia marginata]|uniref:Splicing factor, suppressor of white-apricot n=1 Tax=Elysia marginata TaxID=1093978 RepID=A0AAV4EIN5_9GAST|nr:splicing factor, suppressor of white-apricot [Elysia marginata]